MIERSEIDGRPCAVQYLTRNYQPVEKADAEMIRVVFDDGETMWAYAGGQDENDTDTDADADASDSRSPA